MTFMKQSGTSLTFLNDWLKPEILKCINKKKTYTSPVVRKKFIDDALSTTPILRIFKFLKISKSNGITAILADSRHQILANFPLFPTVIAFEARYRQRITYQTTHSLILVRQANLIFTNRSNLEEDYGIYFKEDIDIMILEILDLEIFGRDQVVLGHGIEKNLKFLYNDEDYVNVCGFPNADVDFDKDNDTESVLSF